ncbi:putative entry exclusion protein TrbK-alt [Sphingomonas sp.]|uniref:putative entry exclusion protein TrbK-alt n=1 Tax=Sphingomonas sp. TaxID=28214 RepID=UPI0025E6A6F4|nr:putative entry exclusion protein TrbK-alt [Sphingomonas sp.]MBV9528099.1 putative entry exclusion protein TrbK-alt [Sphingomonas sp.]
MRGRLLNMPAIGRAVGFSLVGAAIIAAALHFRTSEPRFQALHVSPAAGSDPLAEELQRCQVLATQAKDDANCEAAWAESRRRFFTYPPPRGAATPLAASPKSSGR